MKCKENLKMKFYFISLEFSSSAYKSISVLLILNSKLYFEVNKGYLTVTSQRGKDFIQVEKEKCENRTREFSLDVR